MNNESVFAESFQEWSKRTGGSLKEWREVTSSTWNEIRASEHYHGGKPCREAKCSRYPEKMEKS